MAEIKCSRSKKKQKKTEVLKAKARGKYLQAAGRMKKFGKK